ncbi:MAG: hypothetical protein Q8L47_04450 [bacterium]|nr:hypothetical protein [bacterium]
MVKDISKSKVVEIKRLRALFPQEITVKVSLADEGGFCAEVYIDNEVLYTDAEAISELIDMINDSIRTYFEIPTEFTSYMGEYIPPLEMMQKLGLMPQTTINIPLLEFAHN